MRKTRVVVVDDSATMRGLISATLNAEPDLEVVGAADDPLQARELIRELSPDVLTLDVEMPRMNGLVFLEKIMRLRPMPVVMVSTLTQAGADVTLAALELGAVDCVGKPTSGRPAQVAFKELAGKVREAAAARVQGGLVRSVPAATARHDPTAVVAIGSSTGGVEALTHILAGYPADCPPTVITQHMPPVFTASFAGRLDRTCAATVAEASDGAPLEPGRVYIAPGGSTHLAVRGGSRPVCVLQSGDPVSGHRPSVDVLFRSCATSFGANAVGVILTGMGRDGAEGLGAMRAAGARTLGQDEASSVIYGMPKAAFERGAVERQVSLARMCAAILDASAATNHREYDRA